MKEKIQWEITMTESKIKKESDYLEKLVAQLKNDIQSYSVYDITSFVPNKVARIEEQQKKLQALNETLQMLKHFIAE